MDKNINALRREKRAFIAYMSELSREIRNKKEFTYNGDKADYDPEIEFTLSVKHVERLSIEINELQAELDRKKLAELSIN